MMQFQRVADAFTWHIHAAAALCFAISSAGGAQDAAAACQWQGSHHWLSTRSSPLDSVVLTTPALTVKVCYSRPSARGRAVFASLARFGKVWRTGANEPTTLQLSAKASVAGVSLSEGRYVLMTIPRPQNWIILFFTTTATEPAAMFQTLTEVGQGIGTVERLEAPVDTFTIRPTETFTISSGTWSSAVNLYLEWDRVRVRIPIIPRS